MKPETHLPSQFEEKNTFPSYLWAFGSSIFHILVDIAKNNRGNIRFQLKHACVPLANQTLFALMSPMTFSSFDFFFFFSCAVVFVVKLLSQYLEKYKHNETFHMHEEREFWLYFLLQNTDPNGLSLEQLASKTSNSFFILVQSALKFTLF